MKNIGGRSTRGAPPGSHTARWRGLPPRARHLAVWAPGGSLPMPFGHKILFALEKITENPRDFPPPSARRNLGGALLPSGGAILPGKLPSWRGKSKPSSSPTLRSSSGSSSSSTSSPAPSHLQNPSSSLVFNLCIKPQIGTWGC